MILIVSHAKDVHVEPVRAALERRGATVQLLDLASFPQHMSLGMSFGDGAEGPVIAPADSEPIRLRDVDAIWWRRPMPFELDPAVVDIDHRRFVYRECSEAFGGLWHLAQVRWVNHPAREEKACHKPWQLALAERAGLRVPPTCITNDPARARAFVESRRPHRCVFKALAASRKDWRETRIVSDEELALLDRVRLAPVIFQEYVEAEADVRVTVVGDTVFATEIDARGTRYPHDFRLDFDRAKVSAVELPRDVEKKIRSVLDALGLVYATIDLRRRPDGEHAFLEVNPTGQWLFLELATGQPMSDAVADLLVQGPASRR